MCARECWSLEVTSLAPKFGLRPWIYMQQIYRVIGYANFTAGIDIFQSIAVYAMYERIYIISSRSWQFQHATLWRSYLAACFREE